ncbi:Fimbrial protein [Thalassocella blandensis]|nr:Fimbrial protein [Thalassocella blandensis]
MSTSPYQTPSANMEPGSMVKCIGCSKDLHFTAAACPHCGASQRTRRYKSKTVAALFAFFLGGFGAHRFYLGQWWGVFYLLFFWAWIPGLIALIEFFVFLLSNSQRWDEKYNEGKPAGPNEKGGGAAIVILAILGGFVFIAIIGVLAAVSIPAYQDYTQRAKISQALVAMTPIRQQVESFISENGVMPDSNIMIGLDEPFKLAGGHELIVSEGGMELILVSEMERVNGKSIIYTLAEDEGFVTWDCKGGTLPRMYRPQQCRSE